MTAHSFDHRRTQMTPIGPGRSHAHTLRAIVGAPLHRPHDAQLTADRGCQPPRPAAPQRVAAPFSP